LGAVRSRRGEHRGIIAAVRGERKTGAAWWFGQGSIDKSFLFLFFKKESAFFFERKQKTFIRLD
jgi:hypothetical protein